MNIDCMVIDCTDTFKIHGCWLDGVFYKGKLGSFNYLLGQEFSMRDARQMIDALPQITGLADGTQYPIS